MALSATDESDASIQIEHWSLSICLRTKSPNWLEWTTFVDDFAKRYLNFVDDHRQLVCLYTSKDCERRNCRMALLAGLRHKTEAAFSTDFSLSLYQHHRIVQIIIKRTVTWKQHAFCFIHLVGSIVEEIRGHIVWNSRPVLVCHNFAWLFVCCPVFFCCCSAV